ncbi:DNA primase, partial [Psychrobacter proteolyticus]
GLKAFGLVRQSESARDYDLLRDRVIFPIRDTQGRTIGFGGRALEDAVKPKYINSSASPVVHKQHIMYGYY